MKSRLPHLARALAASSALFTFHPAQAESPSGFAGGTLTIEVGGTAGSGVDLPAHVLAAHFGRHLPGHPTITVSDMPGGGGIRLLDYLHSSARRDGSVLGALPPGSLLEPLIGARKPAYRADALTAIGAMGKDLSLCVSTNPAFTTIEDARRSQMVVAGTGAGANPDVLPVVLNRTIGTKFKVVTGYLGTRETVMAMERKEADGRCGWSWESIKAVRPGWISQGKLHYLLQFATRRAPQFPNTPTVMELLKSDTSRQMWTVLLAPLQMSRPLLAPPGLPPERTAVLRKAFLDTMKDPGFVADMTKLADEPLDPTSGEAMQSDLAAIYNTPAATVNELRAVLAR